MRLPLTAVLILILLSLVIDIYIWLDLHQAKSRKRWKWCDWHAISSIVMWIFLAVTICMPHRGMGGGVYVVMWMLTIYLSIYLSKLVYCIFSLLGRIPRIWKFRRWYWTRQFGFIAAIVVFGSIWSGVFYTRSHIQTTEITLTSQKLPAGFDDYRIVQISDLHLGTWGENTKFVAKLVDKVNAMEPDLIVFTGDAVNQKADEMIPFIKALSRLKAKDGVYSILGNHDYGDYVDWPSAEAKAANLDKLKKYQALAGWKMLNNDHVIIRNERIQTEDSIVRADSIVLIGVENWGDPPFARYGDLKKAYPAQGSRNIKDEHFKILLTHNPAHWVDRVRKESNIDLSLSGHTHAMQASVSVLSRKWSPAALRYKTWGGFYTNDENGVIQDFGNPDEDSMTRSIDTPSLYVNIGAGEVGIPFRLFIAYPEITLITLKK